MTRVCYKTEYSMLMKITCGICKHPLPGDACNNHHTLDAFHQTCQASSHRFARAETWAVLQTFSLPLAAAMGCCSFEAYNAPYILHGVKEVSPCKTETVYMDRDFMDTLVAGVMEVRLSVVHTAYLPHVPVTAAWCVGGGEMCGPGRGGSAQKAAGMTASVLLGGTLAGHPSLPSSRRVQQHRTYMRLASAGEHMGHAV